MKVHSIARSGLALLAVATLLGDRCSAQRPRPKTDAAPPAAVGKVAAYEANKSITVEVRQRGAEAKKVVFDIVKDKTKVELLGTTKAIEVGTEVRVWADKDNPKAAARITAGAGADAAAPTATGKVVVYEADKSITLEVKRRNAATEKREFAIVKDKTKVEFLGTTKSIEVGAEVRIWADQDNPKAAARITAGTPQRGRRQ